MPELASNGSQTHQHNTRHAHNYCLPIHHLSSTEKKTSYSGAKMWNALPEEMKKTDKLLFGQRLKIWLQDRPFYSESTKDPGGKPLANGVCETKEKELVNGNCNGTEEVEKGETEANEKGSDKKDEPEVVFIQDMGFTVKIVSPGTEAFDIQVSFLL
ncbi:hypothetical protein J6590_081931 [Homalodisca vitripennis]|nr:hypothetical protein J6590_081931 [Homalodisca vitripennis]